MAGLVTVLTGPPGCGKTTIARALAEVGEKTVHVEADWFWRFIRSGFIPPWLSESHRQNEAVMDIVGTAVAGYAAAGYDVIADGMFGPWLLDPLVRPLFDAGIGVRYVVLRTPLGVAVARATARSTPDLADDRSVRKMHDEFADLGEYEQFAFDADGKLDAVVTALSAALASGRFDLRPL